MTTTNSFESFQLPIEAAEAYEASFVPAFFSQWAPMLCDAAGIASSQGVLDVGCGTGIVARTAADRIGAATVVGVALNEAMLTVARRVRPEIDWRQADATSLPLDDGSFDAVLCQMALMFFPDPARAVQEMARVTAPGGTVAVLVPASLGAGALCGHLHERPVGTLGVEARSLLGTYFACGELDELTSLVEKAGLESPTTETRSGTARFPSIEALVATEVDSTPLGERITTETRERIRGGARDVLAPFTTPDGSLEAPVEVHILAARRSWPTRLCSNAAPICWASLALRDGGP